MEEFDIEVGTLSLFSVFLRKVRKQAGSKFTDTQRIQNKFPYFPCHVTKVFCVDFLEIKSWCIFLSLFQKVYDSVIRRAFLEELTLIGNSRIFKVNVATPTLGLLDMYQCIDLKND